MLTGNLLRYDVGEKEITPRYLTRRHGHFYLKLTNDLLSTYRAHIGKTRKELAASLEKYGSGWAGHKIVRGLTKIIDGFADYQADQKINYTEERIRLFEFAENFRPIVRQPDVLHKNSRDVVLEQFFGKQTALSSLSLYGDLAENHKLAGMKHEPLAEEIIRRYNLALAQGILYRCSCMHVRLWDSYKTVFHHLKLAGLMHAIEKHKDHFFIHIDGPTSLFRRTQKYGVHLARFLPGLMLAKRWTMQADIDTPSGRRFFHLDDASGLVSYYKNDSLFDSSVEEAFYRDFEKQKSEWAIRRETEILDLGDTVFIPDFTFYHRNGCQAMLEIVGFWTPEYLQRKIEKIQRANRRDLIVAVNEKLNCSKEDFPGVVIFYRMRVKAEMVLAELDKLIA
ncbi:DUF790 family protein [candidate division KSB1 bacterium]|nr:DUF790 family protein [candidate division KSB1 bacterium]RQW08534.1 MAG: DUF790 family protein [candidate division KSB1 bacterium]